ncbi:MAG TPA: CapA family protein [Patescibacteria group bacterium]|nr:CapA family protein [Patescibacteria group bacterium]
MAPRPVAPQPTAPPPQAASPQPALRPVTKTASTLPKSRPSKTKRRRGKKFKRFLLLLVFLLVLAAAAGAGYKFYQKRQSKAATPAASQTANTKSASKPTGTVRFIAIGDNLAFESINNAAKKTDGSYDYLPMMDNFKPFFDKADIRLCNESTPGGGDKNGLAISAFPTFNAPLSWSTGLAGLGCNVVNLASDHINDKGQPAIDATRSTWDQQKNVLAVSGASRSTDEQSKINYFTVKGLKFAYLAYTTSTANKDAQPFSINLYSDSLADKQLDEAHKNANLVIVSMNWGSENSGDINGDQDRIAQHLADKNADVVVGGGPHVLQPAKVLNGQGGHQTLVWYSLGNFLNSELPVENLIGGMAIMDFDVATQKISDPKLLPVYMHYEWTAQQKASNDVNSRKNFKLYPLDQASAQLANSQNNTTVAAQTSRITGIITKFIPVKVITSSAY